MEPTNPRTSRINRILSWLRLALPTALAPPPGTHLVLALTRDWFHHSGGHLHTSRSAFAYYSLHPHTYTEKVLQIRDHICTLQLARWLATALELAWDPFAFVNLGVDILLVRDEDVGVDGRVLYLRNIGVQGVRLEHDWRGVMDVLSARFAAARLGDVEARGCEVEVEVEAGEFRNRRCADGDGDGDEAMSDEAPSDPLTDEEMSEVDAEAQADPVTDSEMSEPGDEGVRDEDSIMSDWGSASEYDVEFKGAVDGEARMDVDIDEENGMSG